jgi:hypothetical protein
VLLVSLRDGSTRRYDLREVGGRDEWSSDSGDRLFVASIRGVCLTSNGVRVDLPVPRRFRRIRYGAELVEGEDGPIAERVTAFCDDVVLALTMHLNGRTGRFRLDLDRRGTARFVPG